MTTAIDLIARALPAVDPPEAPAEGVCCVTGELGPTIRRGLVIQPSFTQRDLLRAPGSDRAGVAAWRALGYAWERKSSWVCNGETFVRLRRAGVREHVLGEQEIEVPCACYATTSYKKHGALRTPVNPPGRWVWLWEMRLVDCSDRAAVWAMWERLRGAQEAGIHRPMIERVEAAPGYVETIGWRVWREFERWARERVRSPLYQFLTYLLPSKAEMEGEAEPEPEALSSVEGEAG